MCSSIFDVICVNETKCDDSVNDKRTRFTRLNLLRRDRSRNGGGVVALYVKNGIDFKCREDLSNSNVEHDVLGLK